MNRIHNHIFTTLALLFALALLSPAVLAQEGSVKGRVTDAQGNAIAGAAINISEQNRLVYTDAKGAFTLKNVKTSDDVIITAEGFVTAAVSADFSGDMTVVLQSAGGRYDRKMALPFHQAKLRHVSVSTSTMTGTELEKYPVNELQNAFMGNLTGVVTRETHSEPGWGTTETYIRGLHTTNTAARAPLVIVDNIERDIAFLDAYPIENVTVLKDAAATAIYGMRGANGVIFVTTKRGTPGKTDINFTQEVGFQNIARMPEYQNAYNYAMTYNRALYLDGKSPKYTDEQIGYYRQAVDGTLPDELKYKYVNTNWEKETLRDYAPQYRTNINISGGGKSVRYYTSFSYARQEGFYDEQWAEYNSWSTQHVYNRFNLRSNIDIDVTKRFTLSLDLGGRLDNISQTRADVWGIFTWLAESNPTLPITNPNGSFAVDKTLNKDNSAAYIANRGVEKNRRRNLYTNVQGNLDLGFITQGLTLKGIAGFDSYGVFQSWQEQAWDGFYYDPDKATYTRMRTGTAGLGDLQTNPREMSYNINLMGWVDYARAFGRHDLSAKGIIRTYKNVTPGYVSSTRYLTYNGIVNYVFNDRLSVQAVATVMGSDNYQKGERYGFFPGLSVSYDLSREKFLGEGKGVVTLLKPRASVGRSGQNVTGVRAYPYQSQYQEGNGYNFGTSQSYMQGVYEQSAGNPNTKWELSDVVNVGLDFDLWHSKLYGNVDAFQEWRSNILVSRKTMNDLLGIADIPMDSYGKTETKGVELVLGHRNSYKSFSYFVEANLSYNTSKVIDIDEVTPQYAYQAYTGNRIAYDANQDYYLVYDFLKYFQSYDEIAAHSKQLSGTKPGHGMYADTNLDGTVDGMDRIRQKYNEVPEIVSGFRLGFNWKGFFASAFFVGQFNRTVELRENVDAGFFWNGKSTSEVTKTWGYYTNDPYDSRNVNALYPRLTTERSYDRSTYQWSSLWRRNGNLVSLRNVEVGYSLPKHVIQKAGMSQLRIYLSGYNVFTWDHIKTFDAESPMSYLWGYPKARIFSLGINLGF